ncbi:REP-associated tyrosine transposase [Haloferula sp.]|uniref:REP-associated tyrosine transposase n=1 Tax=Haloferula sp. TaxID=2497595 RepID=UPI00329C98FB
MESKGWHRRGYLPHLDVSGRAQGLTFRLADSLPATVIENWRRELFMGDDHEDPKKSAELSRRIAKYEDRGRGDCLLRQDDHAEIVEDTLKRFDGERYELLEWCVMPNHVHVLTRIFSGSSMEQVVRSWKNYTAREINKLIGRSGRLWAPDYFDRLIRDEEHLGRARRYIRFNPVKAGLCSKPEDWRWSSAFSGTK